VALRGKLMNQEGELIAEGPCELEELRGQVTMWPDREVRLLRLERGDLTLELDNGRSVTISGRPLSFRVNLAGNGGGNGARFVSMYRLPLAAAVQSAEGAASC